MNWKIIFKSFKNRDMQKRLLIVLLLIVVYRLMAHIPVPLAKPTALKKVISSVVTSSDFGGFLNLISGGALANFSIALVGITPFITSSIIVQLLTKAIPRLEEQYEDGEAGRRKINQWTRIITLPLAIIQSIAYIYILRESLLSSNNAASLLGNGMTDWTVAVVSMTAGSMIIMWLGELITEQGLCNGASLIIFSSILSQLPQMFSSFGSALTNTAKGTLKIFNKFVIPVNPSVFYALLIVIVVSLILLYILVKINEAQRVLVVNYAKRVNGNSAYGGVKSILPIRLISAGVVPVIFAVAFLAVPDFIGQILKATNQPKFASVASNLISWFQSPTPGSAATGITAYIYPILYFILVIFFTYFYTSIIFNSNEIADNLQKQGGFIANIRPGKTTENYLDRTVNRLLLFGSLVLGLIAITPFIGEYALYYSVGLSTSLSIGGTGLLIVVQVSLESLRQINSRALMITYDEYK